MEKTFEFTQDWAKQFRANVTTSVKPHFDKHQPGEKLRYLEIGVFEGRSGCFALEQFEGLSYTGIDLWQPEGLSPTYYPDAAAAVVEIEGRARKNLGQFENTRLLKGEAVFHAASLMQAGEKFDIIYIDAAHFALNVVAEAAICWQMLVPGGVMLFDDYFDRSRRNTVKSGGESFLSLVYYRELFRNHQLGIVKRKESQSQPLYRQQRLGHA